MHHFSIGIFYEKNSSGSRKGFRVIDGGKGKPSIDKSARERVPFRKNFFRKPLTKKGIILALRRFVISNGLMKGSKADRDSLKLELIRFVVNAMALPKKDKIVLLRLASQRQVIQDNGERAELVSRVSPEETLQIYSNLEKQLTVGRKIIEAFMRSADIDDALVVLKKEAHVLSGLHRLTGEMGAGSSSGLKTVYSVKEGGVTRQLLRIAMDVNTVLLKHYFRGGLNAFNEAITLVMREFIDVEFPYSQEQLIAGLYK